MFEHFRQRSYQLERLDTGEYTPQEYEKWQREMRLIHNVWGERRALEASLIRDIGASKKSVISVLDVGAGSGGVLDIVRDVLPGKELFLAAVEINDQALSSMRSGIMAVKGDGFRLPFADKSFDHVISTLTLHHLKDDEAVSFIAEMDRVSRNSFYAVDLNRHPVGYYAYRLFAPLFFQRFTCEDGALSILRSFTPGELLDIACQAGVQNPRVRHSRANRLILSRG